MTTIHRDDHPFALGPRWEVTQEMADRPGLVRFVKWSAQRKLLDQVARWDGTGWDSSRWVPAHPQVSKGLLDSVERHMRRGLMFNQEKWKPIPGYEGFYEVSDLGRVRSMPRKVCHGQSSAYRYVRGRILSTNTGTNGYPSVMLSREGGKKFCTVHRLVMLAFVGPCPDGQEVAHADGNRLNPRLENLRYATRLENVADAIAHGTATRGHRNGCAKLTQAQVLAIRSDIRPLLEIATKYGISKASVSNVKNHKTYSS